MQSVLLLVVILAFRAGIFVKLLCLLEVSSTEFKINDKIGAGGYGEVFKGVFRGTIFVFRVLPRIFRVRVGR